MEKEELKNSSELLGLNGNEKKREKKKNNRTIAGSIEARSKLSKLRNKKVKFALIFLIKTVETFMASVVPSVLSVLVIFLNPNEKSWAVMKLVAFCVTACVNWVFWSKYAAIKSGPKDFYLMNGLTYLLYFASSVIGFYTLGYLVYSMSFANLRVLEIFGIKTIHSVWCANGIMLMLLVCCERFSHTRFNKFREWLKNNGSEKVEMDDILTDDMPVQKDKVVETLSLEELAENIDNEELEAVEAKKRAMDMMPEGTFDETMMTKGHGERVERVDAVDMDNDLTEGDFNAFAAAKEEYEQNMRYSGESLWSSKIYAGRTEDGKPVTEYDEEDMREAPAQQMQNDYDADTVNSLWDSAIYQGRSSSNKINAVDYDKDDTFDDDKLDYDADALWESSFYQGRRMDSVPQRTSNFDEEVSSELMTDDAEADEEALWGVVSQGRGKEVRRLEDIDKDEIGVYANMSEGYDADSLWDGVYQGRKK